MRAVPEKIAFPGGGKLFFFQSTVASSKLYGTFPGCVVAKRHVISRRCGNIYELDLWITGGLLNGYQNTDPSCETAMVTFSCQLH